MQYCWNFVGTKKLVILHKKLGKVFDLGQFLKITKEHEEPPTFWFETVRDLSHHRAVWALEEAPFTCLCLQLTFCNAFDGESGLIVIKL